MKPSQKAPTILLTPSVQQKGAEFADCSSNLSDQYPGALVTVGAIPWILPCIPNREMIREAVNRCDGVMITGGDDIHPSLYVGANELSSDLMRTVVPAEPQRDLMELAVIEEACLQKKPLMAICRGHQLINVAFGGTLYVDLPTERPTEIRHSRMDIKSEVAHQIRVHPGSGFERIFGTDALGVNSTHHQAIKKVAKPFQIAATSPDGIIESIELTPGDKGLLPYFVSTQFHPERLYAKYPEFIKLFRDFVEACAKFAV